jgi:hypothetical protein
MQALQCTPLVRRHRCPGLPSLRDLGCVPLPAGRRHATWTSGPAIPGLADPPATPCEGGNARRTHLDRSRPHIGATAQSTMSVRLRACGSTIDQLTRSRPITTLTHDSRCQSECRHSRHDAVANRCPGRGSHQPPARHRFGGASCCSQMDWPHCAGTTYVRAITPVEPRPPSNKVTPDHCLVARKCSGVSRLASHSRQQNSPSG